MGRLRGVMAKERANEPPVSPAAKPFREAMERLAAGDLGGAVRGMLQVHLQYPDTEEAYFVEEQLARVRRLWPEESQKAGLTEEAWKQLEERAARRRANAKRPKGAPYVVGVMAVLGAWALLVAAAPGTAFLGRVEVPYVFRAVAAVAATYFWVAGEDPNRYAGFAEPVARLDLAPLPGGALAAITVGF